MRSALWMSPLTSCMAKAALNAPGSSIWRLALKCIARCSQVHALEPRPHFEVGGVLDGVKVGN